MQNRIMQLMEDTKSGFYGEKAKEEYVKLRNSQNVRLYYTDFIGNLYSPPENNIELYQIGQTICENILILYRDAKKKDDAVAKALAESLFSNFPTTKETNLFTPFTSLLRAATAFQDDEKKQYNVTYTLSKDLFTTYNEFLNALLGYINIAAKAALGLKVNINSLTMVYQKKIEEFEQLNLHYIMPIFSNLAERELRNAFSHNRFWHNKETDMIEYEVLSKSLSIQKSMPLIEFVGKSVAGSYLALGYITAMAVIQLLDIADVSYLNVLPTNIKSIFPTLQ